MAENSEISSKVSIIRKSLNQKLSEFARNLDIPRSTLVSYENGTTVPAELLSRIVSKYGVSEEWFLSGMGPIFKLVEQNSLPNDVKILQEKANIIASSEKPTNGLNNEKLTSKPNNGKILHEKADKSASSEKPSNGLNDVKILHEKAHKGASTLPDAQSGSTIEKPHKEALVVVDGGVEQGVLIPVISQGISAGSGFDYEEGEIIRYIKVPAWLSRDGRNLVAVPVYGESMEPTLSRGNLAICDLGGFKDDGVYVLRDGERGLMFCKRLIWTPGGWTVVSDNPRYEPMKVEDKSIEVIARVIGAVKEVK